MSSGSAPFERDPIGSLAGQLDLLLAGDLSMHGVRDVEGAVAATEHLLRSLDGYDDLEEAVATCLPKSGPMFTSEQQLRSIAAYVRARLGGRVRRLILRAALDHAVLSTIIKTSGEPW